MQGKYAKGWNRRKLCANHDLFDTVNGRFTISKIADSFSLFVDMLYPADLKSKK